jgi:hypothetical protein
MTTNNTSARLAAIDATTLTPLVQRALDQPTATVLTWTYETIHGGLGTGTVIYRFAGQARVQTAHLPWSLILKVLRHDPSRSDAAHPDWWGREAAAYRSQALASLLVGLTAPRCFAVVDQADESWLWLEEITDSVGAAWPLAHYGAVARQLGQFNGVYLTSSPLPNWPWLSRNWLRTMVAANAPALQRLQEARAHPLIRRWLRADQQAALVALWQERERYLVALDQLPQTLCHLDAFRRNLFTRQNGDGAAQLVAVDWSFTGIGALGIEINPLAIISVSFFDVALTEAQALDEIVFAGYLAGLQDMGWCGDPRQVRLAYTAAAIRYALGTIAPVLDFFLEEEHLVRTEQALGRPIEAISDHFGEIYELLFAQLNEARQLQQILR